VKKRIKVQGFLIFLAVTITLLFTKSLFPHWQKEPIDEFLDALGVVLVLFGFLFRISARGYKSEKSPNGSVLITDGPYAIMRNPMYFGTLLIGTGIIFLILELWTFPIFLLIFLLIYIPQIKREERKLSVSFKDRFKDYCKRTPKYFPNLFDLSKLDLRDYLFLKWRWIKRELLPLILVICVIIAIEIWEDVRLFGYGEFIKELLELSLIISFFVIVSFLFYK